MKSWHLRMQKAAQAKSSKQALKKGEKMYLKYYLVLKMPKAYLGRNEKRHQIYQVLNIKCKVRMRTEAGRAVRGGSRWTEDGQEQMAWAGWVLGRCGGMQETRTRRGRTCSEKVL